MKRLKKNSDAQESSPAGELGRRRFLKTFIVSFILLAALTTLWSLASPLGSVPDEHSHIVKAAAVVRGQWQGAKLDQNAPLTVHVPRYIADIGSQNCYAFQPTVTAACSPAVGDDTTIVDGVTTAGNYNPLYYGIAGWPSTFLAGAPSIYAMRILSGILTSVFFASAIAAISQLRRVHFPLLASAVSITPMVLFLSGSVNPNSLEIGATAAVFANLFVILERSKELRSARVQLIWLAISAATLANTRTTSLIWLVVVVFAALLYHPARSILLLMRSRMVWLIAAVSGLAFGAGAYWAITVWWVPALPNSAPKLNPNSTNSRIQAFFTMLDRTFDYIGSYVSSPGWLDINGPLGAQMVWIVLVGAGLIFAIAVGNRRGKWGLGLLIISIIALPPLLQAAVIRDYGYIWQGRYILAIVVPCIMGVGLTLRNEIWRPGSIRSKRLLNLGLTLMVAGHLYAFVYALRRYTVGLAPEANWMDMFTRAQWQPPLGWVTVSSLYLAVLICSAVVLRHTLLAGQGLSVQPSDISAEPETITLQHGGETSHIS